MVTSLDLRAFDEALDEDVELELEDTALPLQIAAAYQEMQLVQPRGR